jgi:hypothetical protein
LAQTPDNGSRDANLRRIMGFGGIMSAQLPQNFRTYKTIGNIAVPTLGTMLLLIVAFQLWRSSGGLNRLGLASIALGIAVIGIAYYQHRRELDELNGTISDKALSKLCHAANAMTIFGYGICSGALTLIHYH